VRMRSRLFTVLIALRVDLCYLLTAIWTAMKNETRAFYQGGQAATLRMRSRLFTVLIALRVDLCYLLTAIRTAMTNGTRALYQGGRLRHCACAVRYLFISIPLLLVTYAVLLYCFY